MSQSIERIAARGRALSQWWHTRGESLALTGVVAATLNTLAFWGLALIDVSALRTALIALAWVAGLLLLPRLSVWLRRDRLRAATLATVVAVALAGAWILRPLPLASQSGLTFVSPPRISKAVFTSVLRRGTGGGPSPAAPYGEELYDIIVGYGIDPAVALAFFAHESQLCTVGVCADQDTKGWGAQRRAVKASRSSGLVPGRVGTFAKYYSWQDGMRDWCELILGRYVGRGLDTVEKAIPVYAPQNDGNVPRAYINSVYRYVGAWQGRQPGQLSAPQQPPPHTYSSSLDEALIVETFLSSEIEYHPDWAFHKFMVDATRAGRPLGAPLDESRIITVNGKAFAIQVFAHDTLYTPLADDVEQTNWNDVRRLSDLLADQAPGGANPAAPAAAPPAAPTPIQSRPGLTILGPSTPKP